MRGNPYGNKKREQGYKSLSNIILRSIGFGNSDGIIGSIVWVLFTIMEILAVGAKILTRKRIGIRAVGRIRFILHMLLVAVVFNSNYIHQDFTLTESAKFVLGGYAVLVFVLWLGIYQSFYLGKREERESYFRGYSLFTSVKKFNEDRSKYYRLIDPILLILVSVFFLYFGIGEKFIVLIYLLLASSFSLLIEEVLYIYDEINHNLDLKDAQLYAKRMMKDENDISDTGY